MSRVVIVTGGAQGIGYGTCRRFAANGYRVVVADVNEQKAQQAADKLALEGAPAAMGVRCDVTKAAEVQEMVDAVVRVYGRIDALVNNAGICPFIHIMQMDEATWRRTIDVNLNAPFLCTQAVARHMIERGGGGSIIFITSLADQRAGPSQVDYAASKSGVRGAMFGFATALGEHGINCNAVAPGHVNTPLTAHYWDTPEGVANIPRIIPMKRLGQPEDIGNACVFLCSDDARYINGITVRVDGGNAVLA